MRKTALESARAAGGEGYAKARLSMAAAGELCKEDDDGAHDSLINTTSRDDSRQGRESGRPLTAIRCSNSTGSCTQRMQGIHFRGPKIAFIGREMGFFNPFYRELGETCEKMSTGTGTGGGLVSGKKGELEGSWKLSLRGIQSFFLVDFSVSKEKILRIVPGIKISFRTERIFCINV